MLAVDDPLRFGNERNHLEGSDDVIVQRKRF
jgi:hypothetical protein